MTVFSVKLLGDVHSLQQATNVILHRTVKGLCVFVQCTSVLRTGGENIGRQTQACPIFVSKQSTNGGTVAPIGSLFPSMLITWSSY
jgi:hypothetical protein